MIILTVLEAMKLVMLTDILVRIHRAEVRLR